MKQTPIYNTGKVQIGLLYQAPPKRMTADDAFIQSLLLPQLRQPSGLVLRLRRWLGSI